MWKLIAAIAVTISLVALGMANAHETQLNYFVGEPVSIRVVVLIGVCYLAGALSVVFAQLANEAKDRIRQRQRGRTRRHLPIVEDDE